MQMTGIHKRPGNGAVYGWSSAWPSLALTTVGSPRIMPKPTSLSWANATERIKRKITSATVRNLSIFYFWFSLHKHFFKLEYRVIVLFCRGIFGFGLTENTTMLLLLGSSLWCLIDTLLSNPVLSQNYVQIPYSHGESQHPKSLFHDTSEAIFICRKFIVLSLIFS